jgi:hypothetical protein
MATVSIQCIKHNNKETLSFGKAKDGSITLTGTIYDAEQTQKVRTSSGVETKNIGDSYYGITCTVMIAQDDFETVEAEVAEYYANAGTNPLIGLVFECRKLGRPVEGIHPERGHKSLNVIINRVTFLEVEEPDDIVMEDDLNDITSEAAEIANVQKKESLREAVARRLGLVKQGSKEVEEKAVVKSGRKKTVK